MEQYHRFGKLYRCPQCGKMTHSSPFWGDEVPEFEKQLACGDCNEENEKRYRAEIMGMLEDDDVVRSSMTGFSYALTEKASKKWDIPLQKDRKVNKDEFFSMLLK